MFRNPKQKNPLQSLDTFHRISILLKIWSSAFFIGWGIQKAQMPSQGAEAKNYIIFGHSLPSTLQALTCLYEAMPSHGTPYPGAPYSLSLSYSAIVHWIGFINAIKLQI